MVSETKGTEAWLLELDAAIQIAVGQFELIHIVDKPEYINIPQAPEYCKDVIIWNNHIVPVMNLSLIGASQSIDEVNERIVAILAYADEHGEYIYGGIKLLEIPELNRVQNSQQCQLPEHFDQWTNISLSCFRSDKGNAVPIIDVAGLFSANLSNCMQN